MSKSRTNNTGTLAKDIVEALRVSSTVATVGFILIAGIALSNVAGAMVASSPLLGLTTIGLAAIGARSYCKKHSKSHNDSKVALISGETQKEPSKSGVFFKKGLLSFFNNASPARKNDHDRPSSKSSPKIFS